MECYRQARLELSDEEFKAMRLRVVGEGEMALGAYFKAIRYARLGSANRVLQGGALLVDRYGSGFKLKFYDRIDNKPVFSTSPRNRWTPTASGATWTACCERKSTTSASTPSANWRSPQRQER